MSRLKMTQRRALEILIRHAAKNIAGTGCGIRPPVENEADEVKYAIAVVWPRVYSWSMGHNDWMNLGIQPPRPAK